MNLEDKFKNQFFCDGCPSYSLDPSVLEITTKGVIDPRANDYRNKEAFCFLGIEGFEGGYPKHRPQVCIGKLGEEMKDNTLEITTVGGDAAALLIKHRLPKNVEILQVTKTGLPFMESSIRIILGGKGIPKHPTQEERLQFQSKIMGKEKSM